MPRPTAAGRIASAHTMRVIDIILIVVALAIGAAAIETIDVLFYKGVEYAAE